MLINASVEKKIDVGIPSQYNCNEIFFPCFFLYCLLHLVNVASVPFAFKMIMCKFGEGDNDK